MPLTVKELDALKPQEKPYRVLYEKGLYLEVKPSGAKSWVFRFTKADGSRTWMGLGGYPDLGAAKAALKAGKLRMGIAEGIDPLAAKREEKQKEEAVYTNTLRKVAEDWYQYKLPTWSAATAAKCRDYLDKDILPELGDRPITSIEPGDTAGLMKKIENRKAFNVAKKVRQWLRAIFSYAIAHGLIRHNPASELTSIAAKAPDAVHYPWLPDTLKSFVDEQVSQGSYGTNSEYVRELIRKDQDRLHLRGLLLAGAASAPAAPADPAYFEGLRDRVRKAAKDGVRG